MFAKEILASPTDIRITEAEKKFEKNSWSIQDMQKEFPVPEEKLQDASDRLEYSNVIFRKGELQEIIPVYGKKKNFMSISLQTEKQISN